MGKLEKGDDLRGRDDAKDEKNQKKKKKISVFALC